MEILRSGSGQHRVRSQRTMSSAEATRQWNYYKSSLVGEDLRAHLADTGDPLAEGIISKWPAHGCFELPLAYRAQRRDL